MKKKPPLLTDPAEMRRCAEARLGDGQKRMIPGENAACNLLHELQVCQIEQEMLGEALRQTRVEADTALARYTKFYDSAPVGYFTFERDGTILEANPASAALLGIESSKLCGRRMSFFIQCKERPVFNAFLVRVFTGTGKETCDLALKCADAVPRLVRIEASADEARQTCCAVMTDITRFHATQRQLEEQLRQIENVTRELNSVFDSVSDPMFLHDQNYRITRANHAYADRAGMSFKEILGKPYYEVFPKLDGPLISCSEPFNQEGPTAKQKEIRIGNGEIFDSRAFAVRGKDGSYLYTLHIMENITGRKQAEQLRELEKDRLRASLQLSRMSDADDGTVLDFALEAGIRLTGSRYGFVGWINEDASSITIHGRCDMAHAAGGKPHAPVELRIAEAGIWAEPLLTRQPLILNDCVQPHPHERDAPEEHMDIRRFLGVPVFDGEHIAMIVAVANKEQEYAEMEAISLSAMMSEAWRVIQRNRAGQALQHAIRAFKTLSAGNHELVYARDETQLLQAVCRVVVETGGYRAAWVGYTQHDAEKIIRPMAQCGFEEGYMEALKISWADNGRDREPASNAISSNKPQIVQDIAAAPANTPWKERALQSGFASVIALPLHVDGEVPGCLTIISSGKNAFNQGEIALLEEMADDLAFGIRMLRLRQEQQRGALQLRKVLEGTVQAIAAMVEMRDPYTAGHQRRVAQLASAIAAEMGLSEEQVRGIHLAGTIHDLGKIQTPAEILSKPGKLSHGEFIVIKDHAQNSYNILKDIVFPWPIAQMAWQHHEKLDGSGYPLGLKGNEIMLEARILTVADVVEAMSSHRPYRPGLGIDAALEEIFRGRGVIYDSDAADICTSLFREKGFRFE